MDLPSSALYLAPWLVLAMRSHEHRLPVIEVLPHAFLCCGTALGAGKIFVTLGMPDLESAILGSGIGLLLALQIPIRVAFGNAFKSASQERPPPRYSPPSPKINEPSPIEPAPVGGRRIEERNSPSALKNHPGATQFSTENRATGPQAAQRTDFKEVVSDKVASQHPARSRFMDEEPPLDNRPGYGRNFPDTGERFDIEDWRAESFLKRMGYAVGANGLSPARRTAILMQAYERPLPADMPPEYRKECGTPASTERLQRIVGHLQGRISLAQPRRANMRKAISDWRSDLRWLEDRLGRRHPRVKFFRH